MGKVKTVLLSVFVACLLGQTTAQPAPLPGCSNFMYLFDTYWDGDPNTGRLIIWSVNEQQNWKRKLCHVPDTLPGHFGFEYDDLTPGDAAPVVGAWFPVPYQIGTYTPDVKYNETTGFLETAKPPKITATSVLYLKKLPARLANPGYTGQPLTGIWDFTGRYLGANTEGLKPGVYIRYNDDGTFETFGIK